MNGCTVWSKIMISLFFPMQLSCFPCYPWYSFSHPRTYSVCKSAIIGRSWNITKTANFDDLPPHSGQTHLGGDGSTFNGIWTHTMAISLQENLFGLQKETDSRVLVLSKNRYLLPANSFYWLWCPKGCRPSQLRPRFDPKTKPNLIWPDQDPNLGPMQQKMLPRCEH